MGFWWSSLSLSDDHSSFVWTGPITAHPWYYTYGPRLCSRYGCAHRGGFPAPTWWFARVVRDSIPGTKHWADVKTVI